MLKSRRQAVRTMLGCVIGWFVCATVAALLPLGAHNAVTPIVGILFVPLAGLFLFALVNWLMYLNRDINRQRATEQEQARH